MNNKPFAIITGGTRGIGAAMADHFENSGYSLMLTGTNPDDIATRNQTCGPNRRYIALDLADAASLDRFLAHLNELPRLDVCINNAGINIVKPVDEATPEDLDRINAVNYRAPYLICQAAARVMKRTGTGGHILNVASIWSVITKPNRSLYAGAKSGLVGMTRALAVDLAPDNILVNALSPGFTLTDMTKQNLSEEERHDMAGQIPLGRIADPAEMARVAAFLCSPDNTYLTGQNIVVDGGFTIT